MILEVVMMILKLVGKKNWRGQQEELEKKAQRLKEMENRRLQAQQRKADEEKARAAEEERKHKEEADRRKREREEHTDKRPLRSTTATTKKVRSLRLHLTGVVYLTAIGSRRMIR